MGACGPGEWKAGGGLRRSRWLMEARRVCGRGHGRGPPCGTAGTVKVGLRQEQLPVAPGAVRVGWWGHCCPDGTLGGGGGEGSLGSQAVGGKGLCRRPGLGRGASRGLFQGCGEAAGSRP